jgi:hypothetical protein
MSPGIAAPNRWTFNSSPSAARRKLSPRPINLYENPEIKKFVSPAHEGVPPLL